MNFVITIECVYNFNEISAQMHDRNYDGNEFVQVRNVMI